MSWAEDESTSGKQNVFHCSSLATAISWLQIICLWRQLLLAVSCENSAAQGLLITSPPCLCNTISRSGLSQPLMAALKIPLALDITYLNKNTAGLWRSKVAVRQDLTFEMKEMFTVVGKLLEHCLPCHLPLWSHARRIARTSPRMLFTFSTHCHVLLVVNC